MIRRDVCHHAPIPRMASDFTLSIPAFTLSILALELCDADASSTLRSAGRNALAMAAASLAVARSPSEPNWAAN